VHEKQHSARMPKKFERCISFFRSARSSTDAPLQMDGKITILLHFVFNITTSHWREKFLPIF